jgi:hypothetical protein
LVRQDDHRVTFSYRDSQTSAERLLTLPAHEFLRRFLQHVLPKGFRRVRTYGWLSPAAKKRSEEVGALLDVPTPTVPPVVKVAVPCAHCQKPMRRVATFKRGPPLFVCPA